MPAVEEPEQGLKTPGTPDAVSGLNSNEKRAAFDLASRKYRCSAVCDPTCLRGPTVPAGDRAQCRNTTRLVRHWAQHGIRRAARLLLILVAARPRATRNLVFHVRPISAGFPLRQCRHSIFQPLARNRATPHCGPLPRIPSAVRFRTPPHHALLFAISSAAIWSDRKPADTRFVVQAAACF
jgi:hypothetical protein